MARLGRPGGILIWMVVASGLVAFGAPQAVAQDTIDQEAVESESRQQPPQVQQQTLSDADPLVAEIQSSANRMVEALNAANVDGVLQLFLATGEIVDELGVVHRGHDEIRALLTSYFETFPGAKTSLELESVRRIGPVVIEEGRRTTVTADASSRATVRYIAVRTSTPQGWQLASVREFIDTGELLPGERLLPLSWMIGQWVNEGGDGRVRIDYHWSDDGNYILGEFTISPEGQPSTTSKQRIAWDASAGTVRSWTFDSDGGFAQALWTPVEDGWVIKSNAVLPDAQTGSATVTLTRIDANRYSLKGTDRVVGNRREEDFELVVVRQPPAPKRE